MTAIVPREIAVAILLSLAAPGCSRRHESTSAAAAASAQRAAEKPPTAEADGGAIGVVNAYFFAATPDEVSRTFVGWVRPLPLLDQFVTRTERNPLGPPLNP